MNRPAAVAVIVILGASAVVFAGCTSDDRALRVFAAASLADAFEELADDFEAETGTGIALQFAGSSVLATQIDEGAPADVFASANDAVMETVGVAVDPVPFATNELLLALPAGNEVASDPLASLALDGVVTGLCDAAVPCGSGADALLAAARVTPARITREADVRGVTAKLELDEVDAGIIYATDVHASNGRLEGHDVSGPAITYPISAIDGSEDEATAFVDFVLSEPGQAILARHGFGPPP